MQNSKDTRVLTVLIATAVLAAVATPISLANTQEAEALMKEGDLKLFYFNAIKKDPHPKLPAGFVNRGNCYRAMKDYRQAIEEYNNAIRLAPKTGSHPINVDSAIEDSVRRTMPSVISLRRWS